MGRASYWLILLMLPCLTGAGVVGSDKFSRYSTARQSDLNNKVEKRVFQPYTTSVGMRLIVQSPVAPPNPFDGLLWLDTYATSSLTPIMDDNFTLDVSWLD